MVDVDPTSDLGEDVDEDEAPDCATCGEPVVDAPDHRVVTRVVDGNVEALHFCDESCRLAWDGF